MKKIATIPFVDIESIPRLIKDFLEQKIPGFEDQIFSAENIRQQFHRKKISFATEQRKVLFHVLKEQHAGFDLTEKQLRNLTALQDDSAFTVCTGHQLNLFSGPVFFIFKILQTIKLADFLNEKFPDKKIVPIFWMASEDHDFAEINHFRTEENYYEIHAKSGGAVGKIIIEDTAYIPEFEKEFKDSVFGTALILLLKKAYKKGNTFAEATRILAHELFADHGLLILDGDNAMLKKEMRQIFEDDLLANQLYLQTENTVNFLAGKYGKVQVNPREINLFYLSDTRNRIEFRNGEYAIVGKDLSFSREEIFQELEIHPERFSPNALLRPVYQENVLPNICYIGGNAEIMYWLELRDYFREISLPFPVLVPRNSLLFVREKTLNKIEKAGLNIIDFFGNFADLTKDILLHDNGILRQLNMNEEKLLQHFDELSAIATETDRTFRNLVQAEKTRQLKSFERMKKRLLRAEKIKQKEKLDHLENLFLKIHPGKNWQERSLNFSVFFADFGHDWLQNCYEGINVQKSELSVFSI